MTTTPQAALGEIAAQAIRDSNGTPEALEWWRTHPQLIPAHVYAAAVLAVLPPPVDRPAVLREVFDALRMGAVGYDPDALEVALSEGGAAGVAVYVQTVVGEHVRRMADETQADPEAHPPTHTWKVESPHRDTWASWGATHDERVWAAASYDDLIAVAPQRPFRLVRATTTYVVEAERQPDQPAAEAQPCTAARLPFGRIPADPCVRKGKHWEHTTAEGHRWIETDEEA